MHPYFLAIPLPAATRSRLAAFCYGLPQVRWVEEENFHLTLRYFGPLTDTMLGNIQDHLEYLFFHSFPLVLQGVGHFHAKGNRGIIWIGIADNPHLAPLRKEIDRQLRDLKLPPEEHPFHPHITLGYYDRLNPKRLGDYLTAHADYQSWPIEVSSCVLMRSLQTPKHTIYETIDEYGASQLHTDED
jgi:RNA 2',3'-cyclic 3'-phosphodiesterase